MCALAVIALAPWLVSGASRTEPASHGEASFTIAGCESAGPVCEVAAGSSVRIVARSDSRPVAALASRLPCRTRGGDTFAEGPSPLAVTPRAGDTFLCVRDGASLVEVPLARAERPEWYERARAARAGGRASEARDAAEPHANAPGLEGARALGLLGRLAMARGDTHEGATFLARAVALHRDQGRIVEEGDDRFALAYTLATHEKRYDDARAVLDAAMLDDAGDLRAKRAYYRAIVEHQAGETRQALARIAEAEELLARQGLAAERVDTTELEGLVLLRVGRLAEAKQVLLEAERTFAETTRPCTRATRLVNLAIATLRAYEWGGASEAPNAPLEALGYAELARTLGDRACPGGLRHASAQLHAAHAALLLRREADARAMLEDARAALPRPSRWFLAGWHEIRARADMAQGESSSAERELRVALAYAGSPHDRWALHDLRARALLRLGRNEDAIGALRHAEEALDDVVATSPLGDGRARSAAARAETARTLVDTLLISGDTSAAYEASRRARARALGASVLASRLPLLPPEAKTRLEAGLAALRRELDADDAEASSSWALPTAELDARERERAARERTRRRELDALLALAGHGRTPLAEAPADTVTLFPFVRGARTFVFVAHRRDVRVHEARGSATLEELLGPLAPAVARAARVRILATGDTRALDLHALPLGGVPLALVVPTTYALDVARPDVARGAGVLLVADPSGNLPFAREEVLRVAHALDAPSTSILRQESAVRGAVEQAMEGRALLYFAGHARAQGLDGSGSALELAAGTRLGVGDVLRARRPPRHVILSACEAAREEGTNVVSLGVAQAFVLAGSASVLAPDVAVPDRAAMELASRVAAALGDEDGDAAAAMVKAFRADPPSAAMLRAFRVIGP